MFPEIIIHKMSETNSNFLSLEVKLWAYITYKHGIYELPYKLPNDLRFQILEL